jgi:hypothetical protein
MRRDDSFYHSNYQDFDWVVATQVYDTGESGYYFLEPAERIDEGCVAVSCPMPYFEALQLCDQMKHLRDGRKSYLQRGLGSHVPPCPFVV